MIDSSDIIVHIPHASTNLSLKDYKRTELFLQNAQGVRRELNRITDWYTDELFAGIGTEVAFPWSRLLVDVERFFDDEREPMAARGRGVIYTHDAMGKPLRHPAEGRLRNDLHVLYHQHHNELTQAVDRALETSDHCLIIDAHSFPDWALPIEMYRDSPRTDICIGTDSFHTPKWLTDKAAELFDAAGFSVGHNRPFAGTIVPINHLGETPSVHSIMIEINRKLYLKETIRKKKGFDEFKDVLQRILEELVHYWRKQTSKVEVEVYEKE